MPAQLGCTACGAVTDAACDCGAPYVPAGARAAAAIAANPEKSNRAIAKETGVDKNTVAAARRKSGGEDSPPEKRVGQDGKSYPVKSAKPKPAAVDDQMERDRKQCVALGQKVNDAERELAQWLLDHVVEEDEPEPAVEEPEEPEDDDDLDDDDAPLDAATNKLIRKFAKLFETLEPAVTEWIAGDPTDDAAYGLLDAVYGMAKAVKRRALAGMRSRDKADRKTWRDLSFDFASRVSGIMMGSPPRFTGTQIVRFTHRGAATRSADANVN